MSPNSGIGRRDCSDKRAGAVVRRRLVEVSEQQQVVGAVADVGEIDKAPRQSSRCTDTNQLCTRLEW